MIGAPLIGRGFFDKSGSYHSYPTHIFSTPSQCCAAPTRPFQRPWATAHVDNYPPGCMQAYGQLPNIIHKHSIQGCNILRHYNRLRLKIRPICSETMFAQASMSPRQIRSSAVVPNSRSLAYTSKTGNPTTPCRCTKGKGGNQIPGYS